MSFISSIFWGGTAAVWFPISAFVAMGLDHSVANMFIIPYGILRGANLSITDMMMKNLLPVTIGNIIGGALFVMLPFGITYGNWFNINNKKK
jgi:formate transporter